MNSSAAAFRLVLLRLLEIIEESGRFVTNVPGVILPPLSRSLPKSKKLKKRALSFSAASTLGWAYSLWVRFRFSVWLSPQCRGGSGVDGEEPEG